MHVFYITFTVNTDYFPRENVETELCNAIYSTNHITGDSHQFKYDPDLPIISIDSDIGIPPIERQQRISCGRPVQ
jgi:hypothetical protein